MDASYGHQDVRTDRSGWFPSRSCQCGYWFRSRRWCCHQQSYGYRQGRFHWLYVPSLHLEKDPINYGADLNTFMEIATLVGRAVMKAAANSNLKKVTLELGGKSPTLILDDSNFDEAVRWAAFGITSVVASYVCVPKTLTEIGPLGSTTGRPAALALECSCTSPCTTSLWKSSPLR